MATMYQKKTAIKRRTSDIERLAKQYQQQIGQLTTEYETQYGQYQTESQAKMSEYEKQAAAYNQAFTDYQTNVLTPYQNKFEAYNTSLENYNKQVEAFNKNPGPYDLQSYWINQSSYVDINGNRVDTGSLMRNPKQYGFESVVTPFDSGRRGSGLWRVTPTKTAEDPGQFTGTVPEAPAAFSEKAPTAPELGSFDTTQFDEKRGQLEQTFKREVGERKAGRLAAVSRKSARPLLQGA